MNKTSARWLLGWFVRRLYGKRIISVKGEAGVPLCFRPAEYPVLLRGPGNIDSAIRQEWARLLGANEVILDVGANIGFTVQRFYSILNGRCHIWAFEPIPRNRKLLEANVRTLASDRITLVDSAVGDFDGEAVFCDNINHGALSRLASTLTVSNDRWPMYWKRYSEIKVRIMRLDTFIADHPEIHPTLVKIDVEGAGAAVLTGAGELLGRYKPAVNCEFHGAEEQEGVTRILAEAGYRRVVFHEDGDVSCCPPDGSGGNFVHPSDPRMERLGLGSARRCG